MNGRHKERLVEEKTGGRQAGRDLGGLRCALQARLFS